MPRNESEGQLGCLRSEGVFAYLHDRPAWKHYADRSEKERRCCDPKDGELYGIRAKSQETAMEARSGF